jgi:hypothetical protein
MRVEVSVKVVAENVVVSVVFVSVVAVAVTHCMHPAQPIQVHLSVQGFVLAEQKELHAPG